MSKNKFLLWLHSFYTYNIAPSFLTLSQLIRHSSSDRGRLRSQPKVLRFAMTARIGVQFGAGSAAKRILLFAINVTILVSFVLSIFTAKIPLTLFLSMP